MNIGNRNINEVELFDNTIFNEKDSHMLTLQRWKELRRLAISGDTVAEFEVGLLYDGGEVDPEGDTLVKSNARQAVFWYRRAANHGNSSAQNSLGVCLSMGRGIRKNEQEALFWLKKAFRHGDPCAANNIATIYNNWENQRRALFWYQQAANRNDDDAFVEIGWRYYYGKGVKRDYQTAIEYYQKAIHSPTITEAGKQNAMYYLGVAYKEGKGVEQSLLLAQKWLEQANCDKDHVRAQQVLQKIASTLSKQ